MELQHRVRIYQNAGELEAALTRETQANWELKHICPHGANGILAIYSSSAPREIPPEVAPWDHAAHIAEEANLTHEFTDPRAED